MFKGDISPADLSQVLRCGDNELISSFMKILSLKKCNNIAHGYLFPVTNSQLHYLLPFSPTEEEKEFFWYKSILEVNKGKIDLFYRLDCEYQNAFLSEKSDLCLEILSNIKKELGISLWYIKNKITCLQTFMGLKEQKAFFDVIDKDSHPVVSYVSYFHSLCAESAISLFYYKKHVEKEIVKTGDGGLDVYIEYNLLPFKDYSRSQVKDILRYAYRSSITDLACAYYTYVECHYGDEDSHEPQAGLINDAIELIWQGNNEGAKEVLIDGVQKYPSNFAFIDLLTALPCEYKIDSGVLNKIIDNIQMLKSGEGKAIHAAGELAKIACLNWYSIWGKYLYVLALQDYDFFKDQLNWVKPIVAASISGTPLELVYIDKDFSPVSNAREKKFIGAFNNFAIGCLPYQKALDSFTNSREGVELLVSILLAMDQPGFALEVIREFSKKEHCCNRLKCLEAVCYARLSCLDELLSLIVNCAVKDTNFVEIMPLATCKQLLDEKNLPCSDVQQLIFLHVFSKYFSGDFDALKRDWLDDYFCSIDVEYPKEIFEQRDKIPLDQLKFFLKNICTEQAIDTLPCFKSTAEVSQERIDICKLLIELDAAEEKEYKDEITGIMRTIRIKARRQGIEKSKVYVDTEGLKRVAEQEISDDFMRLKALWSTRDGRALRNSFSHASDEILRGVKPDMLHHPKNEIYTLFAKIILKLTDLFVSNTEYGLDGYLSVRIRHGTLSGLLRSPLEELHLITPKDSSENEYKENLHWKNKADFDDEVWASLNTIFCELSSKYDDFIQNIISTYIQVEKNSQTSPKKFNFSTSTFVLPILAPLVESSSSVEQFISKIFNEYLIVCLKQILKEVREDFKAQFKNEARKIVDNAIVATKKLSLNSVPIKLLIRDLTSAKTKITTVFDHASEWFVFSEVVGVETFLLQDVFEISEENTKMVYPHFKIRTEYQNDIDSLMVKGSFFHFVDIFDNIFQNVARHSGPDIVPEADIVASLSFRNIVIKTSNKVAASIVNEEYKLHIAKIADVIKSDGYLKYIKTEQGTGLCKIYKIVTHDIGNGANIKFEFDEDNLTFIITIAIPVTQVEIYEDSNR